MEEKMKTIQKSIKDLKAKFKSTKNIKKFPDISNWNTKNVTNMSGMFNFCENIENLPDISKWDTSRVTNMNKMFSNCTKLSSLPDIGKWNTSNLKEYNYTNNQGNNTIHLASNRIRPSISFYYLYRLFSLR